MKKNKLYLKSIAIVDSVETYRNSMKYSPEAYVVDNVLLHQELKKMTRNPVIYIEHFINQDYIDSWGKVFINWGLELDKNLNILAKSHFLSGSIKEVSAFSMFLSSLICRIEGINRSLDVENIKKVIISVNYNKRWSESSKHKRFISPFILLANNNFFGKAEVIINYLKNDFLGSVNYSISDNWILRLLAAKFTDNICWKLLNLKTFRRYSSKIVFRGNSEIIKEVLIRLVYKRIFPVSYESIMQNYFKINSLNYEEKYNVLFNYKDFMASFLDSKISEYFNYNEYQIYAIKNVLISEMGNNLISACKDAAETDVFFETLNKKYKKIKAVIVSSPIGTSANYFHQTAKKNNKLVLNFEHGLTTGIAMRNKYYMPFSEATNCDYMFVSNKLAKKDYENIGGSSVAKIFEVGIASQCSNLPYKYLQTAINRKNFKLSKKDFCICHVSTLLFSGSVRYGPHSPRDEDIVDFNNLIIKEVYNKLSNKKIVFKDYPSKRFVFQPSLKDRISEKKKHITFLDEGDWRYIRAAADLIVTMTPTSTFSWCLGTKVPIIWLELPWAPLRHSWLNKEFKKAFFTFDVSNKIWTEELKDFLSLSKETIYEKWLEKEPSRNHFLRKHLLGDDNAAYLSANIISKLIN